MPPRPKYTREEIIRAAYELTREKGIDAVAAREVGKRLNTSASPIFTVWNSMEELKAEVLNLAKQRYRDYMADIFDYAPAFKEFGMRFVAFAAEEPNLYQLLFLSRRDAHSPYAHFQQDFAAMRAALIEEIVHAFQLSECDAEGLLDHMIVFANGIAAFVLTDPASFSKEAVSRDLSQVCLGLVLADRIRYGTMDAETARAMARASMDAPLPRKLAVNH
ncbi:MAG: TetR/AcrR family transcriptional regulator [Candidatus Spyradocola sp.]